ncbi:MAG: type II toxin-antitoxin system RelE/ParE family toxin [Desulfococcaceae bacterium]|nr:type II toxin-antitoxin system RelE/ParE family toxin [Desulfococcaceae bacterium]
MHHKIYPTARRQLIQIWKYTDRMWGEEQADKYIHGIYNAIDSLADNPHLWREVEHKEAKDIYFIRHKHHYVFFRQLASGNIGVISVLHERMDIPGRLKTDTDALPDTE